MPSPNAKRPGRRGDSRAANGDQIATPISGKSTRDAAIEQAASWYAEHRDECPRPVIPHLRLRFGLTAAEACMALGRAAA